jgi:glucuronate isomerase
MKNFLCDDFMLENETAKILYHETAKNIPIIDYHCHISPKEIAEDKKYENIAAIWLNCGDHYKWRAIRANGYGEDCVTGNASDYEKFSAWAHTLPKCIGNPLNIWAHMELKKYFGYLGNLSAETLDAVWDLCNEKLKNMSARSIMRSSNVKLICTTDDPADSLEHHKAIKEDQSFEIEVLPAFRPDKGLHIEKPGFADYMKNLSEASGIEITGLNSLFDAYSKRLDYFVSMGAKTADNGFEAVPFSRGDPEIALKKALCGKELSKEETDIYKTELMLFLAGQYQKRGLVMQIHFGVGRNSSDRLFSLHGPDAGADGIGGHNCIPSLSKLLNELDKKDALPKTVLYSVNPTDNAALAALAGCFQNNDCGVQPNGTGKMHHGAAWWYNDTKTGMRDQLINLANHAPLANFVGMLTDSRSFISYPRHDYFRRILCQILGEYVEAGEYPDDFARLSAMVSNICYNNTNEYFGFGL